MLLALLAAAAVGSAPSPTEVQLQTWAKAQIGRAQAVSQDCAADYRASGAQLVLQPATVAADPTFENERAAVRSGPPPMPKKSGFFGMFGGDDVVNNAPVRSYDLTRDGFVITLLDGQVWQQTDDDAEKHPVRWEQPASSMRVTISQGAMNSFNLVVGEENLHHKVRRIR